MVDELAAKDERLLAEQNILNEKAYCLEEEKKSLLKKIVLSEIKINSLEDEKSKLIKENTDLKLRSFTKEELDVLEVIKPLFSLNREDVKDIFTCPSLAVRMHNNIDADFSPAISIVPYGRFGNNIIQFITSIFICKKLGFKTVMLPSLEMFGCQDCVFRYEDIDIIISNQHRLDRHKTILCGSFFSSYRNFDKVTFDEFAGDGKLGAANIAKTYLKALLKFDTIKTLNPEDLVVHFRGGDNFLTSNNQPVYAQPPFAFYKESITRHRDKFSKGLVYLIFEDRKNPCLDKIEKWLIAQNIPFIEQSGTLQEDYAYIMGAHHIVSSFGTFLLPAFLMSDSLETLYEGTHCPIVKIHSNSSIEVHKIVADKSYWDRMLPWRNTQEQRALMLTHNSLSEEIIPKTKERSKDFLPLFSQLSEVEYYLMAHDLK